MDNINQIISKSLEIKRALAVKMFFQDYSYSQISKLLNVSQSFVEKWRALYNKKGADCFVVNYKGSKSYLQEKQKEKVYQFIQSKLTCLLEDLISYIKNEFDIQHRFSQIVQMS